MKLSIKFRMLILFGCSIAILFTILGFIVISNINSSEIPMVKDMNQKLVEAKADELGKLINSYLKEIEIYSNNSNFKSGNMDLIKTELVRLADKVNPDFESMMFNDINGDFYTTDKKVGNISTRDYFQATIKGDKKFFIGQALVSKTTGKNAFVISNLVTNSEGAKIGNVNTAVQLDRLSEICSNIKFDNSAYAFIVDGTGMIIAHPNKDYIMNLNVLESSKSNFQGLEDAGKQMVLGKKSITEIVRPDGIKAIVFSSPIPNTSNWSLGISLPTKDLVQKSNALIRLITIFFIVILGISLIIVFFIADLLSKPIKAAAEHLNIMANADFSKEVPPKLIKRSDEIGLLARSIDSMSKSIRGALNNVIEETNSVKENILLSSDNLYKLSLQIEDVSSTTGEMSAGIEETAASAQEINATAEEIENNIDSIALKAQNGSVMVKEISKRAQDLKNSAILSQKSADDIHNTIDLDIRNSIEQSKAVEQISTLTEAILQITSQTNLLALNAAIEAARAGESGKGFAVVADEIRKLAEDSKNTVTKIQDVTKLVISAVQSLKQSSEKALNFIDETVIKDYKSLVSIGEQYYKDSENIDELVTDFSTTAEGLSIAIQNLNKAINEISLSNNEEAQGTQNIAAKSLDVMRNATKVQDLIRGTKESSEKLGTTVSKFKI